MKVKVLTPTSYDYISSKIDDFSEYYVEKRSFDFSVSPFVGSLVESRINVSSFPDLEIANGPADDLVNAVRIHSAFRHLTRTQAADSRLWASLCHSVYWDYCCNRWPCDNAVTLRTYVKEHYFAEGPRSLVRNGIARLWWFGEAVYDSSRENPYELLGVLLATAETRQAIMEREFWRNREFLGRFLTSLSQVEQEAGPVHTKRKEFRALVKSLNTLGGVQVLDMLPEQSILSIVRKMSVENSGG